MQAGDRLQAAGQDPPYGRAGFNPPYGRGSYRSTSARDKIENWRQDYNHFRTHSSLGDVPPAEFAAQFA
jgi:transposase InsO family protein